MEFVEFANSRRSAINFQTDINITDDELKEIFEVVKTHPSSFNI